MKKILGLTVILLAFVFLGCEEVKYYHYSEFAITKADFESVSEPASRTFENIREYVEALYAEKLEDRFSGNDATEDGLLNHLRRRFSTPQDTARQWVDFLNSNGNNLYHHLEREYIDKHRNKISDVYIIFYAEKID